MVILENENIKATIHPSGAELYSLYHKRFGLEYIWNGDAAFWSRRSPVLFPIVGGLIQDSFLYKGRKYMLSKHGFARDMQFDIETCSDTDASFILKSSDATLKSYPFNFLLRLNYKLNLNSLTLTYQVENTSDETMYFSIGAHPAFNVPLTDGTVYEDYFLEFNAEETSARYTLKENLLSGIVPYLQNQSKIPLQKSLFYEDALIFKGLKSDSISIRNNKNEHGLQLNFAGFPYLGIWAAKDAPFVCIEPWYGIADSESHNQNIEEKEGIIALPQTDQWSGSWSIECF